MQQTLTIQRATIQDASQITEHRRLMFLEITATDPTKLAESLTLFTPWVSERLASGEYIGLIALEGETVAASAGLWRMPFPPGPLNLTAERAYILNVYTEAVYRGRGLATQLVGQLIEEAHALGLSVFELHASSAGRPIYEAMGFQATNQMRLHRP